ncbi:unnamed protein product [Gongylonema pulchrum]|uniref:CTNNB1_binding domain-containing protein n=1 Tax=Gongylonema pulchrum TaxID=637853 RepID=A0A183DKW2_9BILA|nr:unnamed protein product [Gongylonema pulchrum]
MLALKNTPSSKEELSPVPGSGEVEEASEDVPERMEVAAGEDTQELSDITDHENRSTRITSSTSLVIATWIKVISFTAVFHSLPVLFSPTQKSYD